KKLFEYEGVQLEVEEAAIDVMVEKATHFNLGGRGLRSICEIVLTDIMFDIPSEKKKDKFVLTADYVRQMLEHSKLNYLNAA
ncbi:MAG TPA: hypothetical protein VKY44_07285, partial [Flavobacterium sp.]|nr:hypothetical protein [Flavobacterium sp.]